MATPQTNTSAAIFGQAKDPMQTLFDRKSVEERRQREDAAAAAKAKEARNKRFQELMDFAPEEAWEPLDQQVQDYTQTNVRDFVADYFSAGGDVNSPQFYKEYKQRASKANSLAKKTQYLKQAAQGAREAYADSEYFDTSYYDDKLQDIYMNPDGTPKNLDEINPQDFDRLLDDVGGYSQSILSDAVENLPDKVYETIKMKTGNGIRYFDKETITSKLYGDNPEFDPETGSPILREIDNATATTLMADPLIKRMVNAKKREVTAAGMEEPTTMEVLTDMFKPYAQAKKERSVSGVGNLPEQVLDKQYGDADSSSAARSVVRDVLGPIVGLGGVMDEQKVSMLFDPKDGVQVDYETSPSGGTNSIINIQVAGKGDDEDRQYKFDISTEDGKRKAVYALWELYREKQPTKGRATTDKVLDELEQFTQEGGAYGQQGVTPEQANPTPVDLGF